MTLHEVAMNAWWLLVVVVVGVLEYRLGRKIGRRQGYVEGHAHGVDDERRRSDDVDVGKLVVLRRGGGGRPS